MPQGQHRIAAQTGSTAHFAFTKVDVRPSTKDLITFACPEDSVRGWSQAIAKGARDAISMLRDRRNLGPTEVVVEQFTGLVVDTDAHDAYAATLMATLKAGLADGNWPTLHRVEEQHRWELQWPRGW